MPIARWLSSGELCTLWKSLVEKYPGDFTVNDADKITWHRLQEADCEAAQQWSAAKFHLNCLLRYHQADDELRRKLVSIEAHLVSPSEAAK